MKSYKHINLVESTNKPAENYVQVNTSIADMLENSVEASKKNIDDIQQQLAELGIN